MKILSFKFYAVICFIACFTSVRAQGLSADEIKTQLVKEWERAKAYTLEYLEAMPAGGYDFKPNDSIRSFAGQMLHLAQANAFLVFNATDRARPTFAGFNIERSRGAQSKDSVKYYVTKSYDYSIEAVKNLDINQLGEKKKIFGLEETRFALLLKAFEHQTHHRGQSTIYFRVQGMKPPDEKLF